MLNALKICYNKYITLPWKRLKFAHVTEHPKGYRWQILESGRKGVTVSGIKVVTMYVDGCCSSHT